MSSSAQIAAANAAINHTTIYDGEDLASARIDATTIGDLLLKAYDRFPDKTALVFPDSSQTYAELVTNAMRMARGLQAMGVKPRDHVGILMPTSPNLVEAFFAIAFCGATSVMVNARYRASELAYVTENADLVTLLTTDAIAEQVNFVERLTVALPALSHSKNTQQLQLEETPRLRNIVLFGKSTPAGFVTEAEFYAAADTRTENDVHRTRIGTYVRDIGLILYTSGTTANPKGCLLSHEAIVRNSIVLGRYRWQYTADEKVWSPLPLFHIAAMLGMLAAFDAGATFLGMAHFDPGISLQMIQEHKATMMFCPFVTFLQAMLFHPDFESTDLSSLRLGNTCFAAQPKSVGDAYRKAIPQTLQVGTFGMTEACGIVATGGSGMEHELGFTRLGTPLLGQEVRIVDPVSGKDVALDERGEVFIRGFNLFDGYYRDAEKTTEALDEDGWYHSGDIGSLDASGHLMFHGRFKDMLKVGGENVAAAEIEALLARHPAVKLAQIVGIPDPKYAEVPAAYVELKPNTQATEAELIEFCRGEVSGFKVPRHIRFVTEWPMSTSKIQKFQLRNALLDELGLKDH
ncbi:MAG: AMP-dependent synthetase [Verrucomicrobiaceae bacterium]|nr:AMP-dependent synthetase [Verrucomicrobiaceae bacterium]